MAYHRLRNGAGTISFLDINNFRAPFADLSIKTTHKRIVVPIRGGTGGARLALDDQNEITIAMSVYCIGATYSTAYANYTSLLGMVGSATAYSLAGTGTEVRYDEQWGDQSGSYSVRVLTGSVDRTNRILNGRNMIVANVELICTP